MTIQGFSDEVSTKTVHDVGSDGIHTDHDQRKNPAPVVQDVDEAVEPSEKKKTPSAAEQCLRGSPDSLHIRTDSRGVEQSTDY